MDGLALASGDCSRSGYWPPSVPVASSKAGLFTEKPPVDHFRLVACAEPSMEGLHRAIESCGCDVVLELSLACPSAACASHLQDAKLTKISACIGPPADGRVVSGDRAERAVLEAAASMFAAGVSVNFAGPLGAGPVSRLPPTSLAPKVCWPCDPTISQWHRQEMYTDAFKAQWLSAPAGRPDLRGQQFLVSGGWAI